MAEFINRSQAFTTPMNNQALLNSFQSSLKTLASQGYQYNTLYNVGSWELIIGAPAQAGQLPIVYHAVFGGF